MKLLLIVLALVAIYALVVFARFRYVLATAKLETIIPMDRVVGNGTPLRYIAAGDSTAVGEGASKVENTYTYRLADYFAKNHEVHYKNIGVLGAKTSDVLNKQMGEIIDFNPDIVTVSIGANDLTHWKSTKEILDNDKAIIDTLLQKTSAKIYLTNIAGVDTAVLLPLPFRKVLEYRARGLNNSLRSLENDRVKIIDIHDYGWSAYPDLSVTFARDRFHPSDEGYNNWVSAFLSKIKLDYPQ